MNVKKTAVIFGASVVMICGAIGLSIWLTAPKEVDLGVANSNRDTNPAEQTMIYSQTEIMPLYYDDEDILLLPLRNVVERLGGTVQWDGANKGVAVSYHGKKLVLRAGEEKAVFDGREIILPAEPESINGSLYVDESVVSEFLATEVLWNGEQRQISLKTKATGIPIVAMTVLAGEKEGKSYYIEVPITIGLNDASYEKSLNNEMERMLQDAAANFMAKEEGETLTLNFKKGMATADFLSYYWEEGETGAWRGLNVNLREQSWVKLSDLLTEKGMAALRQEHGAFYEKQFYLTEERELVLFTDSDQEPHKILIPMDGALIGGEWKTKYKDIFLK